MNVFDGFQILPPLTPTQIVLLILVLIPTTITLIWGAPWVPTPKDHIRQMLKLSRLKKGEKMVDMGCGDGRLAHIASAEYGADATGLEFSPVVYAGAKLVQPFYRLKGSRAQIFYKNFYKFDLSDIDVVSCYLLPHSMKRLKEKFKKELKPGARVVSYAFEIEGWKPTHREPRNRKKKQAPIWIYTAPFQKGRSSTPSRRGSGQKAERSG